MHILLIHQAFASLDEPGGTRHYELARHLVAHGHRLTVIASPVSYLTGTATQAQGLQQPDGLTILRARVYRAHHRSFFHRLLAFFSFMASSFFLGLRLRRVDLVWGTSPQIFQGLTAWALARLKRVPFLFEVRDLWPRFAIAVGVLRSPVLIRLSLALERFLYRHADRLIVNSPGFIDHIAACGIPPERIALVPNGADPAMFDPAADGAAFRRLHGLEDAFIVLYAGAHGMSNDLPVVLQAAHRLAADPRLRWVFLGDGKEKAALQRQAQELALQNVLFLPPVPKAHMAAALAAADACLAILKPIDEYKTTYPNKVFDYMAAGRPVLLAIDGVIRQVVASARCGLFVPPGDPAALAAAVQQLAADPALSRRMGLAGRAYLEHHFSRQALADRLLAEVESLAASPRHP